MAITEDKRHQPRVAFSEEVWIGQDGIFSRTGGRIRNLSSGGVFVETTQSLAGGSVVNLRFPLGESKELISCSAIVRNVRTGVGWGVEFLDLSSEARGRIAAFVAERALPLRNESGPQNQPAAR
jgi:hypothetical protein